jgi:general secretion pathway protein G
MSVPRGKQEQGFSLVELIVVVAVLGILVAIVIPALLDAVDRSKQRRAMADMNGIAKANGLVMVDTSRYVVALANLAPFYMNPWPAVDAWGNPWVYTPAGDLRSYELLSTGRDGALGPAAPVPWLNDPFEPDLVMQTGQFTQIPEAQ